MNAVYAIGVTAGRFTRPDGTTEHRVRRGRRLYGLDDFTIGAWSAARGVADTQRPFQDRGTVLELHAELLSDAIDMNLRSDEFLMAAAGAFEWLADEGLLVEVPLDRSDGDAFPAFARAHTFRAHLAGLGENPAGKETAGVPGTVMDVFDNADWNLWRRADTATTITEALTDSRVDPAEQSRRIRTHLPRLHVLGARGLGFFDAIDEPEAPVQYMTTTSIQNTER